MSDPCGRSFTGLSVPPLTCCMSSSLSSGLGSRSSMLRPLFLGTRVLLVGLGDRSVLVPPSLRVDVKRASVRDVFANSAHGQWGSGRAVQRVAAALPPAKKIS